MKPLIRVELKFEQDVVVARQRARTIAALLGFDPQEQTRLATAVSEIARNAYRYASRGAVEFGLNDTGTRLEIVVSDNGSGIPNLKQILKGSYVSTTGMGLGLLGAKRLVDTMDVQTGSEGTTVRLSHHLPRPPRDVNAAINNISRELAKSSPSNPYEELQKQNQELVAALAELENRQRRLLELNNELEETNRGVVALYAELDEKADALRKAMEVKTRFLSNLTHEFRTPVNAVLSLSRILLDRIDGELTEEQERQVSYIRKAATELSDLVNDWLDFAKVEAGKISIRPVEFELRDVFAGLRGIVRPLIGPNPRLALVIDDPAEKLILYTDEAKVSQILRNLLSNAIKFTEEGEVRVIAMREAGDLIRIEVKDTGVGIPVDEQKRIFEEFSQVEGEHQKRSKGTGLGLPLSRKLAELLGGSLNVASEPGKGSTFTLILPARYKGAGVGDLMSGDETRTTTGAVLFIESDQDACFAYRKALENTPYEAVCARTIEEAQTVLRTVLPRAIVAETPSRGEPIWAFVKTLRRDSAMRDIPIYVVSHEDVSAEANDAAATEFAFKPMARGWLLERLQKQERGGGLKAVIIDDDETARYIAGTALRELGWRYVEASDAESGIELMKREAPDLTLLDLAMPHVDGREALRRIRKDPVTAKFPIALYTTSVVDVSTDPDFKGQVVGALNKGLPREKLLEELREIAAALKG